MISPRVLAGHGFDGQFEVEAYEPVGCGRCGGTGYKGRIGLYEVMPLSEEIRALVLERASADQVSQVATREGMRRLREDGLEKVKIGRTSIAEVVRVTGSAGSADMDRSPHEL
jgi:type IV pilus assembly protein PilB